ncbi:hypothetical protein TIFTF001_039937 [Ficus carica]|uniref:Uncharacterized protein n=1 Tax=Ficus carica TaxID=3494 RepID=A0AA87YYE8_FICCA|nr:hypothetical protein TIFTF001_039937 [Ficus carica]
MLVIKVFSFEVDHACDQLVDNACYQSVQFRVDHTSLELIMLVITECCFQLVIKGCLVLKLIMLVIKESSFGVVHVCILSYTHIHTHTKGVILHGKYKSRRGLVVFPLSLAKVLNWLLTECLRKALWNSSLFATQHPSLHRPMLFPIPYGSFHQSSVRNLELSYTPHLSLVGVEGMCCQRYGELPRVVEHPNNLLVFLWCSCLASHNVGPGWDELNPDDPKEDGSEGRIRCDSGLVWMKTSQ